MQSLPVTASLPATSTQASAPTDSSSGAQVTEPFGSVLARQRANTGTSHDSKQSATSAANDASATTAGNDPAQASTTDASGTLSSEMLAMLLPASSSASTNSTTNNEQVSSQAATPDGTGTLPSEMLAMLLPTATSTATVTTTTTATDSRTTKDKAIPAPTPDGAGALPANMLAIMLPAAAANGKGTQEPETNAGKSVQSQPLTTPALGAKLQSAESKATAGAAVLLGAQGKAQPEAVVTGNTDNTNNTNKDNTFAVALKAMGNDAAKTAQLNADTANAAKISAQPVAPIVPENMLQSGVAPIVASPSGPIQAVQAVINTPVTDKAWGSEFNQKITWMATQHEQTASLHLNPPNLGPLDVVLKVSGDQATALFTSPHAAVRDVVEQALPQLRDMLAGNGITLGNATVSDQSPRDQQAWQASQQQKGNGNAAGTIDATAAVGSISSSATVTSVRSHQGMVDTFA